MNLKELLKFMFVVFCAITTIVILYIAAEILITDSLWRLSAWDLLKIEFVAFAGTLPVLILLKRENAPRTELIIRQVLHFILTGGIIAGLLIGFGWLSAGNAAFIAALYICLYSGIYAAGELRARKLAKALNERISAFHNDQNETH